VPHFTAQIIANSPKIAYRLAQSAPFNIGLFTSVKPDDGTSTLPTYATAQTTETNSDRRSVLLAHILVTLTDNELVEESDIAVPQGWNTTTVDASQATGHQPCGRTVALHSLAVLPELQGSRVGTTLLRAFIQMVKDAKIVERISLITFEELVPWYERFGFENQGKSKNEYAGKEFYDLVGDFDI
jgi:ribosomal protein S18 acetylase RimI-like enzyme